ncbi:hypothetical protein MP638_001010, partial [Amoeboaphelidium occidentale]
VPDNAEIAQELLECLVVAVEKKGEFSELEGSSGARTEIKESIDKLNESDTKTPPRTSGSMKLRSRKRKLGEFAEETKPEQKIPEYDPSKLETYSVVRLFFAMNNLLPVSQRYKYMPRYQPSLFPLSLTEDCLLGITGTRDSRLWFKDFLDPKKDGPLMTRERTGELVQLVFGLKSKKYRKYRTIGQKDSGERLVLMTSFATDGFSLSVNVIDTRCRKVKHTPPPPVVSRDPAYRKDTDIIMGLDLGQAFTVGAVSWLPEGSKKNLAVKKKALGEPHALYRNWLNKTKMNDENKPKNLAVKKKALGEPHALYRNWLNKTKMNDENKPVRDAENCGLSRLPDETITKYFNRIMERYTVLANFYNSHAIRKRTFEYHCAKQREMDRVFNALTSMVGLKPHQKVKKKQRIYVGIGTGDFGATGSLHTSFLEYFVRKARPLGITILGVDEYFTSQKCVRCHELTESLSMRAKKCSKCNVVFHRDILAAENMCAALSAILEKGERPEYLCKPPDDKSDDDDNDEQDDGLNKKDRNGRNPKEKKKKPKDKESRQSTSSEYALENAAKKKSASYLLGSARVIVQ